MPTYMTELLERCVALQIEAMTSIGVRVDAKPVFFWYQEKGPYFTNRIADTPVATDGSEVTDFNQPTVIMRLIVGHITEGKRVLYTPETSLYEWLPVVKTHFQKRMWLQTASGIYTTRMDGLEPPSRITNSGGLRAFENAGINQIQVGAELTLSCTFVESIEQDFY